jgi:hypothetical protein
MTELRAWIKGPAGDVFQSRNVAELKLFFGEPADAEDLRTLSHEVGAPLGTGGRHRRSLRPTS